jgi:hypothetical protein
MLTVWSVYWGDKYPIDYVARLKAMVAMHLPVPHRFVCLTDQHLDGIETISPGADWPGWWQKLLLFRHADGPSLYFDLDVLIAGDLSRISSYCDSQLAMPPEFSRNGGWQSSVMAWYGTFSAPADDFRPELLVSAEPTGHCRYGPDRLWGDQEYLSRHYRDQITTMDPACGVVSYRQCMMIHGAVPDTASVVAFHGRPNYHEVPNDPFVARVLAGLPA